MQQNWYKTAQIVEELRKEASFMEWVSAGVMAAVLAVLTGSTIIAAAERNNVPPEKVQQAMSNKQIVERVQKIVQKHQDQQELSGGWAEVERLLNTPLTPQEIQKQQQPAKPVQQVQQPKTIPTVPTQPKTTASIDRVIKVLLEHENLLPGQTPFRITNPKMRKWEHIMGFHINKNPKAPLSRKNFLYLKNPSEVPIAVKKLLTNYSRNPSQYGLSQNPSLAEALRKFDQTGAGGKLAFLKSEIPDLNVNAPLKNFIK